MRVTADLFVSAIMRRVFSAGGFAAVVKRGATEAGAVFLMSRGRLGDVELFGPAPQTSYDAARPDERSFVPLMTGSDEEVSSRLDKEKRFDPDLWVVEIDHGVPIDDLVAIIRP